MTAPNSAERKACWDARDYLWKCLDDNKDNVASCQSFQSEFEAKCPAQWVKYPPLFLTCGISKVWSLYLVMSERKKFGLSTVLQNP